MGHFSHDLQPQLGHSPAACLPASRLVCFGAVGSFIIGKLCASQQSRLYMLHWLSLGQILPQYLLLAVQGSLHLSHPFFHLQKASPYSSHNRNPWAHVPQNADIQLCCAGVQGRAGGGAGQGMFKRLLTHPSPTTWHHIPNFLLRSPAYRYLSRAGRAEKLRRSRGVGRADCWIICKTQRLHRHPGSRQEMLICMPCA